MVCTVCNFTGVYEEQGITEEAQVLDLKKQDGCGMYVDEHAEAVLLSAIAPFAPGGLHFLDNGNYHYMTRLFASYMKEPFDLIVFDHHTDDQKPMLEGLKSCGSWIADIREENSLLSGLLLIREAADYEAYRPSDRPLWLSVDKDAFSPQVLRTNWDQGEMKEEEFFRIFTELLGTRRIAAVDICGEDEPYGDSERNRRFNLQIIEQCRGYHLFDEG